MLAWVPVLWELECICFHGGLYTWLLARSLFLVDCWLEVSVLHYRGLSIGHAWVSLWCISWLLPRWVTRDRERMQGDSKSLWQLKLFCINRFYLFTQFHWKCLFVITKTTSITCVKSVLLRKGEQYISCLCSNQEEEILSRVLIMLKEKNEISQLLCFLFIYTVQF